MNGSSGQSKAVYDSEDPWILVPFLCKGAGLKLKKSISDQVCCWVLVTHIGGGGVVAVIVCTDQELGGEKL